MDFGVSDTYAEKLIEDGNDYDIFGHRLFELDEDGKAKNKPSDKKKKSNNDGGGSWGNNSGGNNSGGNTRSIGGSDGGVSLKKIDPNASKNSLKIFIADSISGVLFL